MRTWLVFLVLANLAFAAWALLIDRPVGPPAARDISHLPRLVLASEPLPGTVPAPVETKAAAVNAPGPAPTNATPGRQTAGIGAAATNAHCVTVGPFNDLVIAAAADALLQSRGYTATQRDEPGQDLLVYWVYLDNVPSEAAVSQLLKKLHGSGLADARAMPVTTAGETRRVSVGLFNERSGADRRAKQVKSLGLAPLIAEQHQSQATYWVDINLTSPEQSVSTQGLLPPAAEGAHLEIRACPARQPAASGL